MVSVRLPISYTSYIIIIIITIIIIIYFLKFEWQQVSSGLQDTSQYFGRSQ